MIMNEIIRMFEELNKVVFEVEKTESFPVDIYEKENGFVVLADMPGVKKEDVSISFLDGVLTIEASKKDEEKTFFIKERSNNKLKRTISFGDINDDEIKAKLNDGVLTVEITVKQPEEKIKKNIVIE